MKKFSIVFVLMTLVLMLAACGGNDTPTGGGQTQDQDSGSNQVTTPTQEPMETVEEDVQSEVFLTDHVPDEYYTFGDTINMWDLFELAIGEAPIFRVYDTSIMPQNVIDSLDESTLYFNRAREYIEESRPIITMPVSITNLSDEVLWPDTTELPHALGVFRNPQGTQSHRSSLWLLENELGGIDGWLGNLQPGETVQRNISFWNDGSGYYVIRLTTHTHSNPNANPPIVLLITTP